MRFILKSGKLEKYNYNSRFELQKDILKNAEIFLGENAIILDVKKLEIMGMHHEYMPDAFLLDFSGSDLPELHLVYFDKDNSNLHQTLVPRIVGSLLVLRQNQGRHFADDLTALLLHDPDLLKMFFKGNVRNILEAVREMVRNCSKILVITDGNEYDVERIKEMYGDSWGGRVSHHTVGKILLEGEPVYLINPDFKFRRKESPSGIVEFDVEEIPFSSETEEITVNFNMIDASETLEREVVEIPAYADESEMEEYTHPVRKKSLVRAETEALPESAPVKKDIKSVLSAAPPVKKAVPDKLRPIRETPLPAKIQEKPAIAAIEEEIAEESFENEMIEPEGEKAPEFESEETGWDETSMETSIEETPVDASDFKEEISDEIEMQEEYEESEPEEKSGVADFEENQIDFSGDSADEEEILSGVSEDVDISEDYQEEELEVKPEEETQEESLEEQMEDEQEETSFEAEPEMTEEEDSLEESGEEEAAPESETASEDMEAGEEWQEELPEENSDEIAEPEEEASVDAQEEEHIEEAVEESPTGEEESEDEIHTGEVQWRSFTPLSLIKTQTVKKLLEPTFEKTIIRIKGDKIGMVLPVGRDVFVQGLKYALTYGDVLSPFSGRRRTADEMQEALNGGEQKLLEGILAVGSETETKIVITNSTNIDPVTAEQIIRKIVLPGILRGGLLNQVPDVTHAKYDSNPDYFIKYFSFFDKEAVEYSENFLI